MNRWKAAGYHLTLSILVIFSIAALALWVWYPYGTYKISGIDRLFTVMLMVDITIGPLLTCVVYKQGKASLKRDLAVIAFLQILFLGYGLNTLWQSRPIFLVGGPAGYDLVFANEVSDNDLRNASNPQWATRSILGPKLAGVLPIEDPQKRADMLFHTMKTGVDVHDMPEFYVELSSAAPAILAKAQPGPQVDVKQVDIYSRFGNAKLLIDAKSAQPIRVIR